MEVMEGGLRIHGEGPTRLLFCPGWFPCEHGEFLPSGVEPHVDRVKANISGDGGNARRIRERWERDGSARATEALIGGGLTKMVTSPSICSVHASDELAPLVLLDKPLERVDFPTCAGKEKRRGTKGRVAVDAGFRN